MSGVNPIHKEMIVKKTSTEVRDIITSRLQLLKGKVMRSDNKVIECDVIVYRYHEHKKEASRGFVLTKPPRILIVEEK